MRDVCPHRAFPLSFGAIRRRDVECAYHGWQFDAHTGQCRAIPSLTADSKLKCERIYAGSFPCEERDGYVWAFMTNPEGRGLDEPTAAAPELPKFSANYEIAQLTADLPCGVDQAIIGSDGSGARAFRASGVVVAEPAQHPRKSETVRADSERVPHEPARALGQ